VNTRLLKVSASKDATQHHSIHLLWLPLIALLLVIMSSSGCAFLAGAAVGGAGGYVAGHEAGEDEVREDVARNGDVDDPD